MLKILIKNLDRLKSRRVRLGKGQGATSDIKTQTGAVYENATEVGLCLSPLIEESDIRIFPQSTAEYDSLIAAFPVVATKVNPLLDNKNVLSANGKTITLNPELTTTDNTYNYAVGYSFDKKVVDDLLNDNNPNKVIGTKQYYSGSVAVNPALTTSDFTVSDLVSLIQSGYTHNNRYYVLLNANVVKESKLTVNKHTLSLANSKALYSPATIGVDLNVNYVVPKLKMDTKVYPLTVSDFTELFTLNPAYSNAIINYAVGDNPATVNYLGGTTEVELDWDDFKLTDYTNNGTKTLINGFLLDYVKNNAIADHMDTLPPDTVIATYVSKPLNSTETYTGDITASSFRAMFTNANPQTMPIDSNRTLLVISQSPLNMDPVNGEYTLEFNYEDDVVLLKDKLTLNNKITPRPKAPAVESDVRIFPTNQTEYEELIATSGSIDNNPYTYPNTTIKTSTDTEFNLELTDQWYQDVPNFLNCWSFNKEQLNRLFDSNLPDDHVVGIFKIYSGPKTNTPQMGDPVELTLGELRENRQDFFFEVSGRLVMSGSVTFERNGQFNREVTFNLDDGTEYLKDSPVLKTSIVSSLMDPEFVFESFPLNQDDFNEVALRSNWYHNVLNPFTTTDVTLATVGGDNAQIKINGTDLKSEDVVGKNLLNAITFKQSLVPYLQSQSRTDNFISFNNGQVVYSVGQTLDKLLAGEFYIKDRTVFVLDPTSRLVAEDGFNATINNVVYYKNLVGADDSKVVKQIYELEVKAQVVSQPSDVVVFPRSFPEYQSFINNEKTVASGITYLNPYINSKLTIDSTDSNTFKFTANDQWYQDANVVATGIALNKEQLDRLIASNLPDDHVVYNGGIYTGEKNDNFLFEEDLIWLGDLRIMRADLVEIGDYVIFDLGISLTNDYGVRVAMINLDDGTGYLTDSAEIRVEAVRNLLPANYYFASFPLSSASFNEVANKTNFYANRLDPYSTNGVNVSLVGGSEAETRIYGIDLNPETFKDKNIINAVVFSQTLVPYLEKWNQSKEFIKFNGTDLILTVGQVLAKIRSGEIYIDAVKRLVYVHDTTARTAPETGLELQLANVINYVDSNSVNQSVTVIQNYDLKVHVDVVEPSATDARPVPYDQSEADALIATLNPAMAEYAINPFTDPNVVISGLNTNELIFNINNYPEQTNKLMIIGHSFDKVQVDKMMASSLPDSTSLGINSVYSGAATDTPSFTNTPLTKGDLKGALPYLPVINGRYFLTNQAQITDNTLMNVMSATFNFDNGTGYLTQVSSKISLKANRAEVPSEISCEGATNTAGPLDMTGTYDIYVDDMNTVAYADATPVTIANEYAGNQNKQLAVSVIKDVIKMRAYPASQDEFAKYNTAYETAYPDREIVDATELQAKSDYAVIATNVNATTSYVNWPGVPGEFIGKYIGVGLAFDTAQLNKFLNLGLDFDTVVGSVKTADVSTALNTATAVDYTYGQFLDDFTPNSTNSFVEGDNTVFFRYNVNIGFDAPKIFNFTLTMNDAQVYSPSSVSSILELDMAHTRLFPASQDEFNQFIDAIEVLKAKPGYSDLSTDYVNPFTLPGYRVSYSSGYDINLRQTYVDYNVEDPRSYNKVVPSLISFRADLVDNMLKNTDDLAVIGKVNVQGDTTNLTLGTFRTMMAVAVKINNYYISLVEPWLINKKLTLDYVLTRTVNMRIKLDGLPFGGNIQSGTTLIIRPEPSPLYITDYKSITESQSIFEQVAAIADTNGTWINPFTVGSYDSEDTTQPEQKHITTTAALWSLPADKLGEKYSYGLLLNKQRIDFVIDSSTLSDSSEILANTKTIITSTQAEDIYTKARLRDEFLPTAKTVTIDGVEYYIFVIENTLIDGAISDSVRMAFGSFGTGNRLRIISTTFSYIQ